MASIAESLEPMQVDATEEAEENDNDFESRMVFSSASDVQANGGLAASSINGAAAAAAFNEVSAGNSPLFSNSLSLPRGSIHGEDASVFYNVQNPAIDLEAYAQGYVGLARLYRLRFIAHHCPSLRVEALKLAISYVMNTHNTALFAELQRKLTATLADQSHGQAMATTNLPDVTTTNRSGGGAAGNGIADAGELSASAARDWVDTKSKKAALKLEKLDTDLKNYKSNSIKESIRRGHDDLGDHFLDCGDLSNALKCYSRARDYCTTGSHLVMMCVNVIKVSVYLQNWSHVVSYVNKALAAPDFVEGNVKSIGYSSLQTGLYCAYGLAELASRKYKMAAKKFLMAHLDHCNIPYIMSAQNVATYGGLCALATFDRASLQKQVISSQNFKLFLELDPQLREVILNFYESKYGKCLMLLDEMKDNLLLDIYLARHVQTLYSMIRNRSLVQYFSPYLSADMRLMASSFNTTVSALEDELMNLILEGKIQARIDSHNKVLYAQAIDQRSATFEKAMQASYHHQRLSRMAILRSAILKNNVCVKNQQSRWGEASDVTN